MNENEIDIENELKHWGILGMKWGIRNYQNPDGSLTPLGRIRYGVNSKSKTHLGAASRDIMGVNDANSLSDEELRRMTKRYRDQAQYYEARNNYIQQERYFKQNTSPQQKEKRQSGIGRFMSNVFGQPFQSFMAKNVELGLGAIGYSMLKDTQPELAAAYLSSVSGLKFNNRNPVEESKNKAAIERNNKNSYNDKKSVIMERNKALRAIENAATNSNIKPEDYLDLIYAYEELFNEPYDPSKYSYHAI